MLCETNLEVVCAFMLLYVLSSTKESYTVIIYTHFDFFSAVNLDLIQQHVSARFVVLHDLLLNLYVSFILV